MVTRRERMKRREHTGAADPCNAAMRNIMKRETIYSLGHGITLKTWIFFR